MCLAAIKGFGRFGISLVELNLQDGCIRSSEIIVQNHVSFWIGFFSASFIVVAVAVGAWGLATDQAIAMVATGFGLTIALTLMLGIVLAFKKRILSSIFDTTEKTLSDISSDAFHMISAAARGQVDEASERSGELARSALGWYAWTNFYRWVVGANIALLVTFAGFAGTVLLFEQNKRIREQTNELIEQRKQMVEQTQRFDVQNELLSLSIVSELRERLRAGSDVDFTNDPAFLGFRNLAYSANWARSECPYFVEPYKLSGGPNTSSISTIAELAGEKQISPQVQGALRHLVRDQDDSVALGALLALEAADQTVSGLTLSLTGFRLHGVTIRSEIDLEISESVLTDFRCENCSIRTSFSWLNNFSFKRISQANSSILENAGKFYLGRIQVIDGISQSLLIGQFAIPDDVGALGNVDTVEGVTTKKDFGVLRFVNAIAGAGSSRDYCSALTSLAAINPFLVLQPDTTSNP